MTSPSILPEAQESAKTIQNLEISAAQNNKNLLHPDYGWRLVHTIQSALDAQAKQFNEHLFILGKCHCGGNIVHHMTEPFYDCDKCNTHGESTIIPYPQQIAKLKAANFRHVINKIESFCRLCGHTTGENGCANCLTKRYEAVVKAARLVNTTSARSIYVKDAISHDFLEAQAELTLALRNLDQTQQQKGEWK